MRKQNETQKDATTALNEAIAKVVLATELINAKLAWMKKKAEDGGSINWGHAGTANKVAADLEDLLNFIGPDLTCPDCDSHKVMPTSCQDPYNHGTIEANECRECGAIF